MKTGFLSLITGLMLAGAASATVEDSFLQWPLAGSTQGDGAPITVYSQVLKTDCTGQCDSTACADLTATMFFRAEGGAWESLPMTLNIGNCYAPYDEYSVQIPITALTGTYVDFYAEFADLDGAAAYHARFDQPADVYTEADPGRYNLIPSTAVDFTLHICGDFSCVSPNGAGPGIAGTFNGWNYEPLTINEGDGVYCADYLIPAGSDPTLQFKFRNGPDWEPIPNNRVYVIEQGATSDTFVDFWAFQEICTCPEAPLTQAKLVVFTVDLSLLDPADYSGGVSIQGSRAPLTWTAGATLMTPQGGGVFTSGQMFMPGTLNTLEYKFTRNNGTTWEWEGTPNRLMCLEDNGIIFADETQFWNNVEPVYTTTVDVSVTFSVDMNCIDPAAYAGGVSVTGGGDVLANWTPGVNLLTDGDADGVYTTTLVYPAGSTFDWEHKFNMSADGTNWGWEENVQNRPFSISDENTNLVLGTVAWDNWLCAPATTITYIGGNTVQLDWDAVPTATSYSVYADTNPYFTPGPGNLLGTTTSTTFNHTVALGKLNFVVTANN
jgi:hypothetical protein